MSSLRVVGVCNETLHGMT